MRIKKTFYPRIMHVHSAGIGEKIKQTVFHPCFFVFCFFQQLEDKLVGYKCSMLPYGTGISEFCIRYVFWFGFS